MKTPSIPAFASPSAGAADLFEVFANGVLTLAPALAYIRLTNDGGGAGAARKGSQENWFE